MKDKKFIILVDAQFMAKVDYLKRINNFRNKSDTIRRIIEKEYRKETMEERK